MDNLLLCPYLTITTTKQRVKYEYNEDNLMSELLLEEKQTVGPTPCLRDGCAAWDMGRCTYVEG